MTMQDLEAALQELREEDGIGKLRGFTWIHTLGDTLAAIRSSSRRIPEHYIPILEDGRGGYYYVACQKREAIEPDDLGRVYYNPGDEPELLEYQAADFFAFAIARAKFWVKNI